MQTNYEICLFLSEMQECPNTDKCSKEMICALNQCFICRKSPNSFIRAQSEMFILKSYNKTTHSRRHIESFSQNIHRESDLDSPKQDVEWNQLLLRVSEKCYKTV